MHCKVLGSTGAASIRERALRDVYDEHSDALFGYVLRMVDGDRYKAEDIVQETLLRCWTKWDPHSPGKELEDEGNALRPWLFAVARNLVIDAYRLRKARPQEIDGNMWLDEGLQAETDSSEIDQILSSMLISEAMKALSPAHREVLYQTYFNDGTAHHASRTLGIPLGTVKSRIHYALKALRDSLCKLGVSDGQQDTVDAETPASSPTQPLDQIERQRAAIKMPSLSADLADASIPLLPYGRERRTPTNRSRPRRDAPAVPSSAVGACLPFPIPRGAAPVYLAGSAHHPDALRDLRSRSTAPPHSTHSLA